MKRDVEILFKDLSMTKQNRAGVTIQFLAINFNFNT